MGQRLWTDTSPKKINKMVNKYIKRCPTSYVIRDKLRQWGTTTNLLGGPKSGTLTTANTDEYMEQQKCSYFASGNADIATLEYSLAASYKTKHTLTIWSSSCAPWYLPKWGENLCPHKNLYTNVYISLVHNCQNLEATNMYFSRWIHKLTVVHLDNGILFSAKNKWAIKPWKKHRGTLKAYYLVKEANIKMIHTVGFQLYDFLKKQNYGDVKISALPRVGFVEGEMNRWNRGFLGQWKYSVWYHNDGYMSSYICPNP